ncbi:hypothetical protein GCM10029963_67050 [Micromonospora andamanensis]
MLDQVGHRTPWSEAALRTVTGALAGADDNHQHAAELHLAAAETYAGIPDVTDRMLALTFAVRELTAAGDHAAADAPWPSCAPSPTATAHPACSRWPTRPSTPRGPRLLSPRRPDRVPARSADPGRRLRPRPAWRAGS